MPKASEYTLSMPFLLPFLYSFCPRPRDPKGPPAGSLRFPCSQNLGLVAGDVHPAEAAEARNVHDVDVRGLLRLVGRVKAYPAGCISSTYRVSPRRTMFP